MVYIQVLDKDRVSVLYYKHGVQQPHLTERSARNTFSSLFPRRQANLGEIVDCGEGYGERPNIHRTSMYEVHYGSYAGKYDSGSQILLDLATTAIVAEMTDILTAEDALIARNEKFLSITHPNSERIFSQTL